MWRRQPNVEQRGRLDAAALAEIAQHGVQHRPAFALKRWRGHGAIQSAPPQRYS